MAVGEGIVVVVDGSVWCSSGIPRQAGAPVSGNPDAHFAVPRKVDPARNTDPSELVYKVSPVGFYVTCPMVGI